MELLFYGTDTSLSGKNSPSNRFSTAGFSVTAGSTIAGSTIAGFTIAGFNCSKLGNSMYVGNPYLL